jgi:hypothetical protein
MGDIRTELYIDIPVEPLVKTYLERNVFFKKPYKLSYTNSIGSYLIELIEEKPKRVTPLVISTDRLLRITLTAHHHIAQRPYLSHTSAERFNLFVRKKIKEECFTFIQTLMDYKEKEINECIRQFQVKYGFREEDLPLERMKKAFYRSRKAA